MAAAEDAEADRLGAEAIEAARAYVVGRWPELAGVEPKIARRERRQAPQSTSGAKAVSPAEYVLTFRTTIQTPDGFALPRTARVTIDESGRIIKATLSK
ncbi:MAG: hypothetical protein KatS3mg057_0230 [Herpetosiphonaceae bacterium]|nr:MAG: hypothetical protein KatS3mg057_0230 [Herpetosiphonaceae bacterium]